MVREMMHRVEEDHHLSKSPKVSQYFDMICGSGLGGLLAVMCGVFHMTGDQLVEEFVAVCKVVFSHDLDATQRTIKLEEMKRLLLTYVSGGEDSKMISGDNACKVFVCAASSHNTGHPQLFRNYRSRSNPSPDCTICQAIRATTALPHLFEPIVIRDKHLSETFIGGELRWNNPTDELTREAAREFKSRHVACIVNIGSGHPGHLSLAEGLAELYPRIARDCERLANDMEHRFGSTHDVFWRLSVEQGMQNLAEDLSNLDALVSHTHSYLQNARTQRNVDTLLVDLVRRPERILANVISGEVSTSRKVFGPRDCPAPTQYFTGRQAPLEQLEEHFNLGDEECRVAVLYGMGGSGKTQMGLEFIRRNKSRFSNIYFIDASSKLTLENDLAAIAVGSSDQPSIHDALRILGSRQEEWLLFFDNADDPSLNFRPYISWSHGNVIITTRNRELRVHAPKCSIWVDRLDLEDAKELLLRGLPIAEGPEGQEIAVKIVQELGCLALAITQARAYIARGLCNISEYLPLYLQNRKKLLEHKSTQRIDDYQYSVYTTWTISFNKLSSNAAHLLELLSFMHHDAIPSELFRDAWEVYANQHEDAVPPILICLLSTFTADDSTWDIIGFRDLVGELLSFSLLEFDLVQHTFSLHPLVQQWAQSYTQHHQDSARATQALLSLAAPKGDSIGANIKRKSLLPHFRESIVTGIMQHYSLLSNMGYVFLQGRLLPQSAAVYCQLMVDLQLVYGVAHPNTLRSMNNLALTYSYQGHHCAALQLHEQVLALRKQILGDEHPDTFYSMGNLASTYSDLDQHHDALHLQEQLVELQKRILGEDHPETLTGMQNIANTCSYLDQHHDALQLTKEVVSLRKRVLGEDHPDTVGSILHLAETYSHLGKHQIAVELMEPAVKLTEKFLGEEHPHTLGAMHNLALTFSDLGQHDKASALRERVAKLRKHIVEEEPSNSLQRTSSLAVPRLGLSQDHDALDPGQAMELQIQVLGEEHPTPFGSMGTLALTCSHLGQDPNTVELMEQFLMLRKQIYGEEHPHTLQAMTNLAHTYCHYGHLRMALDMMENVSKLQMQVLGEDHPDTLSSIYSLAIIYSELGQLHKGLELHQKAFEARSGILGEEHPDTVDSLHRVESARSEIRLNERSLTQDGSTQGEHLISGDGETSAVGNRKRKRDEFDS
ncbi:hypothetical protein DL96DRAFT_897628 [Flagelloscypha sp. PMI_526]|nr:hypothetical protein DL96DRAFT_897628 [Flagelloscypha sp. PMI_526]